MMGSRAPRGVKGLTKTQQLRQAKSAAMIRELEQKQETIREPDPMPVRRRRAAPEPKKVDFTKPGMTKAMMAKLKHTEKFREDFDRKRPVTTHQPKRTAAPISGDARLGRERVTGRPPPESPVAGPSQVPRRPTTPKSPRRIPGTPVHKRTTELARTMNADVVQADAIGEGPIENIVIPPGIVKDNRTTIIALQQAGRRAGAAAHVGVGADAESAAVSEIANRSIQVISETLDEQDAVESAAVQSKLTELQQARREFVIAVANVGGNAVNIGDDGIDHGRSVARAPTMQQPSARAQPMHLYRIPDVEDDVFQVRYGRDHPDVIAAREHMQRIAAKTKEKEAANRIEQEFERIARETGLDQLDFDAPLEDEILFEGDVPWEEDEPRPPEFYQYEPFDPEQLERFFDVQRYPPCSSSPCGPPPGKEHLHPDLWELDDPWYREPPEPDVPDLIQFD